MTDHPQSPPPVPSKDVTSYYATPSGQATQWKTGAWVRFPLLAVASLVGVVACTITSIGILISSNNQPVKEWGNNIAVSVYLSILSVIANTLLTVALAEGLVIRFWLTALEGATMSELSTNWVAGSSVLQAVRNILKKGGRITALACVLSAVSVLRGPLNQGASTIRDGVRFDTQGNFTLPVTTAMGDTAISADSMASLHLVASMTGEFSEVFNQYSRHNNITLVHPSCGDTCETIVKGFGFKPHCVVQNVSVAVQPRAQYLEMFKSSVDYFPTSNATLGDMEQSFYAGLALNATFNTGGASIGSGGTLTNHVCEMRGGTVAYKITLSNGVVTLSPNRSTDQFIKEMELVGPSTGSQGSSIVIGGFEYAMNLLFQSGASIEMHGSTHTDVFGGALANQMANLKGGGLIGGTTFNDPMDIMLDALRELSFRASVHYAKNSTERASSSDVLSQTVPYTGFGTKTIYVTDSRLVALAAWIGFMGIISVAATLWGWWELGRDVSMNPLEIAKAFGAPALTEMGSNVPYTKIGTEILQEKVRYGEALSKASGWKTNEPRRLVIGDVERVIKPTNGQVYGR